MPLDRKEKLLVEAIRGYLSSDPAKLGLAVHGDQEETSHTQWWQWENIDDAFALKASESPFHENMTSAFYAVHSYKRLEDPTFIVAMDAEMASTGIPKEWREKAKQYVNEIIENLSGGKDWSERDEGWNPNIAEIADMTRNADNRDAKTSDPFTGGGPAPGSDE